MENGNLHANMGTDDTHIKAMVVLSILLLCLCFLAVIMLFIAIRRYQETRNNILDDATDIDKIDYLIGLLDEQESILLATGLFPTKKMRQTVARRFFVEHFVEHEQELDRFISLNDEFSSVLSGLMNGGPLGTGVFQKGEDELRSAKRDRKKTNSR